MTGLTADVIITMCNSAHLFHVQNFKLEGLFLSKAKKIISMLLVVAMVLTVAPASMIASAYESNYTHGKLTFSKVNFTVDTSATTKVIRVAKAGTFQYGNTLGYPCSHRQIFCPCLCRRNAVLSESRLYDHGRGARRSPDGHLG